MKRMQDIYCAVPKLFNCTLDLFNKKVEKCKKISNKYYRDDMKKKK